MSPNTAAGSVRLYGVLAGGRLSTAPGNAESFPAQPGADPRAHMDAEADSVQGPVQPFLTRAEASRGERAVTLVVKEGLRSHDPIGRVVLCSSVS